jgi:hypothetical protein
VGAGRLAEPEALPDGPEASEFLQLCDAVIGEAFLGYRLGVLRKLWKKKWRRKFKARAKARKEEERLADRILKSDTTSELDF